MHSTALPLAGGVDADLTGANLTGATYSDVTVWPEDFDPEEADAVRLKTAASTWSQAVRLVS